VRFSTFALTFGALLCLALPGLAGTCETIPGNLVKNCDFSDGTYTATIPYLPPLDDSDPGVPNFWDPNDGFVRGYLLDPSVDTVVTDPITGTDYLSISAGEFGPDASLSQGLTDVAGVTYDGNISGVGAGGFGFYVFINGFFFLLMTTDHSVL
jgi:hypothetical protein